MGILITHLSQGLAPLWACCQEYLNPFIEKLSLCLVSSFLQQSAPFGQRHSPSFSHIGSHFEELKGQIPTLMSSSYLANVSFKSKPLLWELMVERLLLKF